MTRPKLSYFDFPGGRGEDCRIALHIAGVEFDDNRIPPPEWPKLKASTPFGKLPVLEIEGKGELAESNAILRFIGSNHDLHPSDAWQAARHEAVMEACEDLRHAFGPTLRIKDEAEKKAAREKVVADTLPTWAKSISRQIGDGPFLGGEKINVADIKLWSVVRWLTGGKLDHVPTACLDAYPAIKQHFNAVNEHDGVKTWYAK